MTKKNIHELGPFRELVQQMMFEAERVAKQLGVKFRVGIELCLADAGNVSHHKTSMLQDLEAGRTVEVDGLAGTVIEIATKLKIETPTLRTVNRLTQALDKYGIFRAVKT